MGLGRHHHPRLGFAGPLLTPGSHRSDSEKGSPAIGGDPQLVRLLRCDETRHQVYRAPCRRCTLWRLNGFAGTLRLRCSSRGRTACRLSRSETEKDTQRYPYVFVGREHEKAPRRFPGTGLVPRTSFAENVRRPYGLGSSKRPVQAQRASAASASAGLSRMRCTVCRVTPAAWAVAVTDLPCPISSSTTSSWAAL